LIPPLGKTGADVTGNEIREKFLSFFESKGHRRVRSSSLVPGNDPSLLFTNAGMNQFKDVFLGLEQRNYKRATSAQKCVRAGGKHNDLENVGFTNRHHTFFEMLGNFSFGDYFKKDAIAYAWELVTSQNWFAIAKDKLYVTIFEGQEGMARDAEAYEHWLSQGVAKERIYEFGAKENFWAMGDTGPCGPCSEIHFDLGPAASDQGHTDCPFGCECGRYVEIWNLVFMQFNRDASGAMTPLPKPSIDTGAGLERLASVLQGKISNYDTDLFVSLMKRAAELCGLDYEKEITSEAGKGGAASLRVIADHARATTFLIADGVLPSNEGRGYVLRKIMRRAISHGRLLGKKGPFLHEMVHAVTDVMKDAYPEVSQSVKLVSKVVYEEERRFAHTLDTGLSKLVELLDNIALAARETYVQPSPSESRGPGILPMPSAVLPGNEAFKLYDTFGLPLDFVLDAARDRGIQLDEPGFERAMAEQRKRARASWKGVHKESASPAYAKLAATFKTEPGFYCSTNARDCRIEAILTKDGSVHEIKEGEEAEVVLDRTVIYAESGGQASDTGAFYDNSESQPIAEVRGAYYPVAGLIAHRILAKESVRVGDRVAVVADAPRREHIKRNHTGTHLVHAALRNILGTHVKQAGSLNTPDHLRFDFSHFAQVDPEELRDIEQQVNEHILQNVEMQTEITSIDDALASGALAFFGDKYPEQNVRVVTIPDPSAPRAFYSKELCGGTHVSRTGDIGVFKIMSEQSVAAGVRRIEAITGAQALLDYQRALGQLRNLAAALNVREDAVLPALEKLSQSAKQLEKQLEDQKRKGALSKLDELVQEAKSVKGVKILAAEVDGVSRDALRQLVDSLRQKLGSSVVVLATTQDGKVAIVAGITKDLTSRLHAGKLAQVLAEKVGGKGGGRPDLAEAGGKDTFAVKSALQAIYPYLDALL
jgi:alanyl-tRNA synthetase